MFVSSSVSNNSPQDIMENTCSLYLTATEVDTFELTLLSIEQRNRLEADSFWCFSKLLDGIQDNYTFAQPGIQNKVRELKDLVGRIDGNDVPFSR